MRIRWRLSILAIQALVLTVATYLATGNLYALETWYAAGVLAVVITPQLLEPYYARPADVIGNSVFSLILIATTKTSVATAAWIFLAVVLIALIFLGIIAMAFGAGRHEGSTVPLGRAAAIITRQATSTRIYSIIFWLALLEAYPGLGQSFWILAFAWMIIVITGAVNWQRVASAMSGAPPQCRVEGMIGPSTLPVSAYSIPKIGSRVSLESGTTKSKGVITSRITRSNDHWAQIHVASASECEAMARSGWIDLAFDREPDGSFLGSVDVGSDDMGLVFDPLRRLQVGGVVSAKSGDDDILYQISSARVQEDKVSGGSHLSVTSRAVQIGIFDQGASRLRRHRWVPLPGAPVVADVQPEDVGQAAVPASWLLVGRVIGTRIPIYLDLEIAKEGHLAILGMTKMGKTSLAHHLVTRLAQDMFVTVLDQTGEYRSKRGLQELPEAHDLTAPGLYVLEPQTGVVAPTFALNFVSRVVEQARLEYENGSPNPRAILIDEAHQFVPEPAGMGFNAPGRDSSMKFGVLMMQVRKYGLTLILVSQRTAVVAKSALSQCENMIAFRSVDQTGLGYIEAIAGSDVREILPSLSQGEALIFGPAVSSESPVAITVFRAGQPDHDAG